MNVVDKFIRYVKIDTQSDENSVQVPSTKKQLDLANLLVDECLRIGMEDVQLSSSGIVYATLSSNTDEPIDSIGFIAHMDTATEITGAHVHPRIISQYDGQTIQLNEDYSMDPNDFPALQTCIGDDLIVTDGTTLLGGDDKAGIAIIMQAMQELIQSKQKHGKIMIAFTCDEEIGRGTDHFSIEQFDVDYAYTVDGTEIENIDHENFNAAKATIRFHGTSIHPGDAKDRMINAGLLACDFVSRMPKKQIPAMTENRQGFYHLVKMEGEVEQATLVYLLRNHCEHKFAYQKEKIQAIVDDMNAQYGQCVSVSIQDQYANMHSFIKQDMRCVKRAQKAMQACGIHPVSKPVRGGTDGARLSEKGLLCPNLGTGSFNHHGRFEFASIQKMEKMVQILNKIIEG